MKDSYVVNDALNRLSRAIQIPTVSAQNYEETDFHVFDVFLTYLEEAFPLFHNNCEVERVNGYGLIYRWPGTEPSLEPILMLAHYDVVPAGDTAAWKYPPFSGKIAEGRVWGRGTLDIKSQLMAHMEAVTMLIQEGFLPSRDIWFAYGQDEETGNHEGATAIAALFEQKGLHFAGLLDEGGIVISGAIKGVKSPVALIGVAEKGRTDYEITIRGSGGHSSVPPKSTALGQIAELVTRIEHNPLPARLTPPVLAMFESIGKELGALPWFAIRHHRLFGGIIKKLLTKNPDTNAMLRTTFAATMARGSEGLNVLPQSATVNINVRLLSGDTVDSVAGYFRKLAGDIPIEINTYVGSEASPVSPHRGEFYDRIKDVTQEIYPEAIISPYLVMGGTDARKYIRVCDNIYRFTPVHVTNREKDTVHNANENISIENYMHMIDFYKRFLKSW